MSHDHKLSIPSTQVTDPVLSRLFRAIPSVPYVLDVPSDVPYQVHPNQTAYEYSRKIGATFKTRDGGENEFHLQHMSFFNRDTSGTLLIQRPLSNHEPEPALPQAAKMERLRQPENRDSRAATPVKKRISLADYKNKSASKSAAPSTPLTSQAAHTATSEPPLESITSRLTALSPSKLLRSASTALPSLDGWPLPLPCALPSSNVAPSKPSKPKSTAAYLEGQGKRLKRAYDELSASALSVSDTASREQLERRALATALESVLCFLRAFDHRERNGKGTTGLWPSLYGLMDLVAHRARNEEEMFGLVQLLEATVARRAVTMFGSIKWDDAKDEKRRKELWDGMNKAVGRMRRCEDTGSERESTNFHRDYAGLAGMPDIERVWSEGITFLNRWCSDRGVEWKSVSREEMGE